MKHRAIKTGMLVLGWCLVLLGIIGFFLPILQGVLLVALGAFILSKHSPWWSEKTEDLKKKSPQFKKAMDTVDRWIGETKTGESAETTQSASDANEPPVQTAPENSTQNPDEQKPPEPQSDNSNTHV